MKRLTAIALFSAASAAVFAQSPHSQPGQQIVIEHKGETIVLEPYAPNIVRVTLSLKHDAAVRGPGYGVIATGAGNGSEWKASQTADVDQLASSRRW